MPDGAAAFEVISVVRRRRKWSSAQKLALVTEIEGPGPSLAAVADRHGVSRSLLFDWRRQMREGTMPGISHASPESPGARFAPVRLIEETSTTAAVSRPAARRPTARSRAAVPIVELALRNGRVLRVVETIAPDRLGRLAAAPDA